MRGMVEEHGGMARALQGWKETMERQVGVLHNGEGIPMMESMEVESSAEE